MYLRQYIIVKMQSIAPNMLINFEDEDFTKEQKQYNGKVWGSIELKVSELASYSEIQRFTTCQCKMVLTPQDKHQIFDWEEISSNQNNFNPEVIKKVKIDIKNNIIWKCRFCNKDNILKKKQLSFASNKSKVIHKAPSKGIKNEPIILIVFDSSASMEEHIFEGKKKKEKEARVQKLISRIKETKIYKKIVKQEEKEIAQFIKRQKLIEKECDLSSKYQDHLKKNKLLMSITELAIQKKSWKVNIMEKKTIGFIFFNSVIKLQIKANDVKTIYHSYDNSNQNDQEKADFQSFQNLFAIGQKYASSFSTPISQFNFDNLNIQLSNPKGQTALGPAIVIALGIISKHGPGSTIIIVTDGIANKGILEETSNWDSEYQMVKKKLIELRATMAMLEWTQLNGQKEEQVYNDSPIGKKKMSMQKFFRVNKSENGGIGITQKIVILSNNSQNDNEIEEIQKKVDACINRYNSIWNDQIILRCENSNIDYDKSLKKVGSVFTKQSYYLESNINNQNLKQIDYVHPFMTQIIVKYKDVKTGEQATFMSYIMQKLIKYKNLKKKDKKNMEKQETLKNVQAFLQAQDLQYSLNNMSLNMMQRTFRTLINEKTYRYKDNTLSEPLQKIVQYKQDYHQNTTFTQISDTGEEQQFIKFC